LTAPCQQIKVFNVLKTKCVEEWKMKKSEFAAAAMTSQTTNCAQSVINAFVDDLGIDRSLALKLALGFGGGMGHTGGTCGAVTAAYMVLGLKQGFELNAPKANRDNLYAQIQEFNKRFKKLHGTVNCTELLDGNNLGTPDGATAVKEKNLSKRCPGFVADAVEIVESMG
jgi:C_GCAxxG_C_C family probable redox protein